MSRASHPSRWLCVQLGAREHYAMPRALEAAGAGVTVFTDVWAPPGGTLSRWLRGRFHPGLAGRVVAPSVRFAFWEAAARLRGLRGWDAIRARNRFFERRLEGFLRSVPADAFDAVFAYSYCAGPALRWARRAGVPGLLGQIDPGPREEAVVRAVSGNAGEYPPREYWERWRGEVAEASVVVANSEWSRQCLVEDGVPSDKVAVVPLAYEGAARRERPEVPERFSAERPLRALFLGQVIARKGVGPLLEAMGRLAGEGVPVTLDLVGGGAADLLERARALPNCRARGRCAREATGEHYGAADVFVLPTYSDGFALTQLEALAWRLPLLVSRFCGEVVVPGGNGEVLERVDAEAIAGVLRRWATEPGVVRRLAAGCMVGEAFSLGRVGKGLRTLNAQR